MIKLILQITPYRFDSWRPPMKFCKWYNGNTRQSRLLHSPPPNILFWLHPSNTLLYSNLQFSFLSLIALPSYQHYSKSPWEFRVIWMDDWVYGYLYSLARTLSFFSYEGCSHSFQGKGQVSYNISLFQFSRGNLCISLMFLQVYCTMPLLQNELN